MAEVPVIINHAMVVDYYGRVIGGPYKVVGLASIAGLEIGGGPVYPPGGGNGKPPIDPGRPTFPIWGPPGSNFPDKPGYPPVAGHPLPDPPPGFPNPPDPGNPGVGKPPPPDGGWGYHPDYGWGYFPGTGGMPGPKS